MSESKRKPWGERSSWAKKQAWERWSKTKLGTLLECPHEFSFVYIKPPEEPVPEHISKISGKALHSRLQKFFNKKKPYQDRDEFLGSWKGYWFGYILKRQYPEPEPNSGVVDPIRWNSPDGRSGDEPGLYYARGLSILGKFWDDNHHLRPPSPHAPLGIERHFRVAIAGLWLEGYIDRINPVFIGVPRAVEIVDYKTGYEVVTQTDAIRDIQFTAYEYGVRKARHLRYNPVKMTLQLLAREEVVDVPLRRQFNFSNLGTLLNRAARLVEATLIPDRPWAAEIFKVLQQGDVGAEPGHFPATPGRHCRFCDFREICDFENPEQSDSNVLMKEFIGRDLDIHIWPEDPVQLDLGLPFRYKKYERRGRNDMAFERHKRKVAKGEARLPDFD